MHIKSPLRKDDVKENKRNNSAGRKQNGKPTTRRTRNSNYGRRIDNDGDKKGTFSLPSIKPWKVIVGALVLGALGILYLNHVFATQQLLQEVNQMEREYNRAKRMHSDYRLTYDRLIGPANIYEQAKQQGFINGGPAEKVIEVEK
jgi:hypothetical protein